MNVSRPLLPQVPAPVAADVLVVLHPLDVVIVWGDIGGAPCVRLLAVLIRPRHPIVDGACRARPVGGTT